MRLGFSRAHADEGRVVHIRYRLLLIRRQSANGRAGGGKTTKGKPKFPAINGGGRRRRPRGSEARPKRDACSRMYRKFAWRTRIGYQEGLVGRSAVRPVQSACAKLRQVPQSVHPPTPPMPSSSITSSSFSSSSARVLSNRSFFFSRYFACSPRSVYLHAPAAQPTFGFSSCRARPRCSPSLHPPSSLATQTSINFAGSGPTVFQFRVSTLNASALDREGGRGGCEGNETGKRNASRDRRLTDKG